MKLQVALDTDEKTALKICEKVKDSVDIIELGTPLIKMEGLGLVKKFKKFGKEIFADMKTNDTGFFEAELAFKAGADMASVSGFVDDSTIKDAVKAARKYRKKILVDLINVNNKKRMEEISKLNPDFICVHTGIDCQKKGERPLKNLKILSKIIPSSKIAVAGGINFESLSEILKYRPKIIVVGSAITKSKDSSKVARQIKSMINEYE